MQTERRVAANPQTKPTGLGCESAERLAATISRHSRDLLWPNCKLRNCQIKSIAKATDAVLFSLTF